MALTASETFGTIVPGFVTDTNGNLSCTATVSGSSWREGFLRDTDGRLVVTDSATGATWQNGFLRGTSGELVYTLNSGDYGVVPGFKTATNGALCFSVEPSSQAWQGGFLASTSGYLAATGITPYAVAVRALSPALFLSLGSQTGLTDLSGNGRNGTGAGSITIGSQTGPLVRGDSGATLFDGTDDRITTTYSTRRNYAIKPLTRSGAPVLSTGYQSTVAAIAGAGDSGNDYFTRATATAVVGNQFGPYASDVITTTAGEQWTFSANILKAAANGSRLILTVRDSGGTILSYLFEDFTGTGRKWATFTMPANAADIGLAVYGLSGTIGDTIEFDGLMMEKTSSDNPYFPTPAQLTLGEAGWTGTAYNSASEIGCFANGTARTFTFWLKRDAAGYAASRCTLANQLSGAGQFDIVLQFDNTSATLYMGGTAAATWNGLPAADTWNHYVVVVDKTSVNRARLYVNGALHAAETDITARTWYGGTTLQNLQIGRYNGGQYTDGDVGWVAVHLRALTADEIAGVYAAK